MTFAPAPARRVDLLVLGAASVTVVLWASSFVVIRAVGAAYDAGSMALLRMAVGTLVLTLIAARTGFHTPPRSAIPLLVAWGVGWFCVYNLALNTAEQSIDAGTTAMVVNLAPLIVVALAGLLLGEGFSRPLLIGAPVSFLGVLIIGLSSSGTRVELGGVLLALLAAVVYAACTLVQKHLLRQVDAATLTWLGALTGTVALLPWAGRLVEDLASAPAGATAAVIYMGVFPTAIAFTTWAYVLSRSTAGTTSATTYVVPALALLMSWAVLGETPTGAMLVGGTLCLVGVLVVRWPGPPPAPFRVRGRVRGAAPTPDREPAGW